MATNPSEQYFLLQDFLAQNPRLISSPELYNFIEQQIYAAVMDRLAQPLPTGDPSPLSSQAPGSAHAIMASTLVHQQGLLAYELNLRLDKDMLDHMRLLDVELLPATFPVINLVFVRSQAAIENNHPVLIPIGTEVGSSLDQDLTATTIEELQIFGSDEAGIVQARLDRLGAIPNIQIGEFNGLGRSFVGIEKVFNDGTVASPGRDQEELVDAVLRAREGIRTGSLAKFTTNGFFDPEANAFLGRCVSPRDYAYYALLTGATKVNVLTGVLYDLPGAFADLNTLIVYPPDSTTLVRPPITAMSLGDQRVDIRGAKIIPIDGTVTLRVVPRLTDYEVRQLAAAAIAPRYDISQPATGLNTPQGINPPAGIWGDTDFKVSLATALENVDGIYAVPSVDLKHAETGTPFDLIEVHPWHLFEIHSTIEFVVER